jgi:hypothetical protein
VGDLAIQHDLSGGVIADVFVSQQRHQALLQGADRPDRFCHSAGCPEKKKF